MSRINLSALCGAIALTSAAVACGGGGGDSTGPDNAVTVAGQWRGTATFPNGFTTTMTLQQTGSAVTGQMSVAGSFVARAVTGQVSSANRTFTWVVVRDCEIWGGVLNIDAGGQQMTGAVLVNGAGCQPVRANVSGMLSVTKE